MKEITKEALLERGFEYEDGEHVLTCSTEDTLVLIIICVNHVYIGGGGHTDYYEVPNCKTLQDLDNLINLFK